MSGRTLAVAAGLALLLLAGVAVATFLAGDWVTYPDLTPPPSGVVAPEPAEAEARLAAAGAALDAFARTGDLPGYRALESHAAIHRPGSLTGSPRILHNLTISWGASGSESRSQQVLLFVANPAGRTLGRTLVCTADGRAETALGQTVLSRPDARAADCVLDRRGADLLPFLPAWPLAAANATRIAADGRVTLESGNATGIRSTLVLDPQGRLELLRVTDPARGTVADLTFEPGERTRAIALPAGRRSPLPLAGTVTFQPGWWNLTLGALPAKAPLSDFQLQVRQTTIGEAPGEPVRIPFGGSGLGFEARVEDRDGDGMLSAGDRISARNPDFRDREGYAFGIHDSWAAATAFGS